MTKTCTIPGCTKKRQGLGMCSMHYSRQYRHGSPFWTPPTTEERFQAKVDTLNGPVMRAELGRCHEFTGAKFNHGGYGQFLPTGSPVPIGAHVYAWTLANGPVPTGMCVCHHCDNPPCCRLDHLWLGTNLDNLADMRAKGRQRSGGGRENLAKTHCPEGHPYDEANTYTYKGHRACRICRRIQGRVNDAKRRPRKRAA